jgi:O-antigen ligase
MPLVFVPGLDSVFAEPKFALLLVSGALGICGALIAGFRGWPEGPLPLAAAAWLGTSALSAIVAAVRADPGVPYAGPELLRLAAVLGVAIAAAQADRAWRRRLATAIHFSAGLVSLLGLLQHLLILPFPIPVISLPGSTFGNRNIAAEAVAVALPFGMARVAGAGTQRLRLAAAASLALQLVYLAVTRTRGAWLGAAAGIAGFLFLNRPPLSRRALVCAMVVLVVTLGAAMLPGRMHPRDVHDAKRFASGLGFVRTAVDPAASGARARLGLWRRSLLLAREHPLVGVGPGNFAVLFPRYAEPGATADRVLSPTMAPRRAHNDLLERLVDTGLIGLAALLAVLAAAARLAWKRTRASAAGGEDAALSAAAAGSLAALVVCGMTGFPLAMPATGVLFGSSLGLLARVPERAPDGVHGPTALRALAMVVAASVPFLFVGMAARRLVVSYWLGWAERELRDPAAAATERALSALARAKRADPGRFEVSLRIAQAALRLDRAAEAGIAAREALSREPYSPNAWATLAAAQLAAGDAGEAVQSARRALVLLEDYPAPLFTLAQAAPRLGDRAQAAWARKRLAVLALTDAQAGRLLDAVISRPSTLSPGTSGAESRK